MSIERTHQSELAQRREANVFIWWRNYTEDEVIACFDVEAFSPITVGTLLRWFKLLASWDGHELALTRVSEVEHVRYVFYRYKETPGGPLQGSVVLSAGDYACYYADADPSSVDALPSNLGSDSDSDSSDSDVPLDRSFYGTVPRPFFGSYDITSPMSEEIEGIAQGIQNAINIDSEVNLEAPDSPIEINRIGLDSQAQTIARYGPKCIFTGSVLGSSRDNPVDVHWIFPPMLQDKMAAKLLQRGSEQDVTTDEEALRDPANMVTMRADVHRLWLNNAISVDVDDRYKIVVFDRSRAESVPDLSESLSVEEDALRDDCFREHLRYTIALRIIGGNLSQDYDINRIDELYDDYLSASKLDGNPNLEDPIWRSPTGLLVLEDIAGARRSIAGDGRALIES